MSMPVREIKAWLDTLQDDDLVGIDEDSTGLTLANEREGEVYLSIGMALTSEYLEHTGRRIAD